MGYYEGIIKNTEFFTTSELAKKLKMNVQVITRKVQAGEISAYKIGKDWRIPEQSVYAWLEQKSNSGNGNGDKKAKGGNGHSKIKVEENRLRGIEIATEPAPHDELPRSNRMYLLEYILAQFEPERPYTSEEVNRVVARYHNDYNTIRGEFVAEGMMDLEDGAYRRRAGYQFTD